MKVVERPRRQSRQVDRTAPALLLVIRVGQLHVVHVATSDCEDAICADLVRDLQDQLIDLREAVLRLNR